MKIAHLTPGTGSYHCGSCVRDNSLVKALRRMEHDAILVPLYLPPITDEMEIGGIVPAPEAPLFYGGVNVYLQQASALFRHTPRWLDRLLDSDVVLDIAAHHAGMTDPATLGKLTVSMLEGPAGHQAKELERLVDWLETVEHPDVICLSNTLLSGSLGELRRRLNVPLIASVQGEDAFIDALAPPWRDRAWQLVRENCRHLDAVVAPSKWYTARMRDRLAMPAERMHLIRNGVPLATFAPAEEPPDPPVIGYLARLCPDKGLDVLVDAFIRLRQTDPAAVAQLHLMGTMGPADEEFVAAQRRRLEDAGLGEDFRISPNVERREKAAYLSGMTVLCVPTRIEEAFGMYVIEALASGVPVIVPRRGALPELVESTAGGRLYDGDSAALAAVLAEFLADPAAARAIGLAARQQVLRRYSTETMGGAFALLCDKLCHRRS